MIGGSQVINVVLAIVRTKGLAVLLGPSGVGLIGLYQGITSMVGTLAGMGIGNSGVRQIAEAAASGDNLQDREHNVGPAATVIVLGFSEACCSWRFAFLSRFSLSERRRKRAASPCSRWLFSWRRSTAARPP